MRGYRLGGCLMKMLIGSKKKGVERSRQKLLIANVRHSKTQHVPAGHVCQGNKKTGGVMPAGCVSRERTSGAVHEAALEERLRWRVQTAAAITTHEGGQTRKNICACNHAALSFQFRQSIALCAIAYKICSGASSQSHCREYTQKSALAQVVFQSDWLLVEQRLFIEHAFIFLCRAPLVKLLPKLAHHSGGDAIAEAAPQQKPS